MKRINWSRDEYILTLNLYYKFRKGGPSKNDPEVIKCSNLLRSMNPSVSMEDEKYRNFIREVLMNLKKNLQLLFHTRLEISFNL